MGDSINFGKYEATLTDGKWQVYEAGDVSDKKAVGVLNSGQMVMLEKYMDTGILNKNLFDQLIIETPGASGETSSLSAGMSVLELAQGRVNKSQLSMSDLACMVIFLQLETAKDNRRTVSEDKRSKQQMAVVAAKKTFEMKSTAALEEKEAAKVQAIGTIVSGIVGVVCGIASIGLASKALKGAASAGKTKSTGNKSKGHKSKGVDAKKTGSNPDLLLSIGKSISDIGGSFGKIVEGGHGIGAAEHNYMAKMLTANAEVMQTYMQTLQADISAEGNDIRATTQHIDQLLNILKQVIQNQIDTLNQVIRNI